jgi:hypothetical protein
MERRRTMKKMFLIVTLMMKGEWLMRNAGVLMLALMLSLAVPATGKVVFNIDIQPDTYHNAYKGGAAAVDACDGMNNWYVQPVFTGTGWVGPYGYNARVLPSAGKPAGANGGLRIEIGWGGVVPDSFIDSNFNGLMSDGAMVNHLYPTSFSTLLFFGDAASVGVFDIYVYSNTKTQFRLNYLTGPADWRTLNGYQGVWNENAPQYVLGDNYLIFENESVNNNRVGYGWSGIQFRSFDETHIGTLSALQLVYRGIPIGSADLTDGFVNPSWLTWAHDYESWLGPAADANGTLGWFQKGEWVQYNVFADGDANEGYYNVSVRFESPYTDANCGVSFDGGPVHVFNTYSGSVDWNGATVDVNVGRWYLSKNGNDLRLDVLTDHPFNIWGIQFTKSADQTTHCSDVQEQGQTLAMDFNGDCVVDFKDMALFADSWLDTN